MVLLRALRAALSGPAPVESSARRVLNVGGASKATKIPAHYADWEHLLLDIDPRGNPDVVCDARKLDLLSAGEYDAVYCSHNLEHYYRHDVAKVLKGFLHVLKPDGFAEIRVPDLRSVMQRCVNEGLDTDDLLYDSAAGPVTVHDVFYGLSTEIESLGVDFYAHKTGFTPRSLSATLSRAGFDRIFVVERTEFYEISALAFKQAPAQWQIELLGS